VTTAKSRDRATFGPNKYGALHLMLARWIRVYADGASHHYVTLGGSELTDVRNLAFVGRELIASATSFEENRSRAAHAEHMRERLRDKIDVTTVTRDVFEYRRSVEAPHLIFIDLEGACRAADYVDKFARFFNEGVLQPGDGLFVTSYLGRNPGWHRVLRGYDTEFRILGISDTDAQKRWYRRAHPSFTLFRALDRVGLVPTIRLTSVGCVLYTDGSPMGLYGYALRAGETKLREVATEGPYLHVKDGFLPAPT
jgi:hypothetical protein